MKSDNFKIIKHNLCSCVAYFNIINCTQLIQTYFSKMYREKRNYIKAIDF